MIEKGNHYEENRIILSVRLTAASILTGCSGSADGNVNLGTVTLPSTRELLLILRLLRLRMRKWIQR